MLWFSLKMVKKYVCISCGVELKAREYNVIFKCPRCGAEIARCGKCRRMGVKYKCPVCDFEGP
jgi:predicted RNA-binding Zn-ribbon protein involved in translation (DUF1610 family)